MGRRSGSPWGCDMRDNSDGIGPLRRNIVLAGIVWTLMVGASLGWNIYTNRVHVLELAEDKARTAIKKDLALRRWATQHGGVYVPVSESTPPSPYLARVPERDVTTPSGRRLTLMNPAYLVRQLGEETTNAEWTGHITSLRLLRPENAPDPWERSALWALEHGAREVVAVSDIKGVPYLRVMVPLVVESKGCLICHGFMGYKLGDLRGGLSSSVSLTRYFSMARQENASMSFSHFGIWLFGMGGIAVAGRVSERRIRERRKSEKEIRELNEHLEQRVAERTAELESFCYSVSHDLRTPLRAMCGFSRLLVEEVGGQLPEKSLDYLRRIDDAAVRMGVLIDNLLSLTRISRAEIRKEEVDLSAMVHKLAEGLSVVSPERRARFIIAEGVSGVGDPRLLRVVMENLFDNAWKYSGRREIAEIEFGVVEKEGTMVYFVRDNGIGFDMSYADKLFLAFQRLHADEEFEGTGIGLAIAQRIIHRHNGRIWGEGRPGEGATFFFTLANGDLEMRISECGMMSDE